MNAPHIKVRSVRQRKFSLVYTISGVVMAMICHLTILMYHNQIIHQFRSLIEALK